jgi:hypothetical protein
MRIDEIASAEDQIALFKLITDKVWQSLADQQNAEANRKAAQPLKSKLKLNARAIKPTPQSKVAVKPMSFKTTSAKPNAQSMTTKTNSIQSSSNHAQSTKDKSNLNRIIEPKTANSDDLDSLY